MTERKVYVRFRGRRLEDAEQMLLPFPPAPRATAEEAADQDWKARQSDYLDEPEPVDPVTQATRLRLIKKLIKAGHLGMPE